MSTMPAAAALNWPPNMGEAPLVCLTENDGASCQTCFRVFGPSCVKRREREGGLAELATLMAHIYDLLIFRTLRAKQHFLIAASAGLVFVSFSQQANRRILHFEGPVFAGLCGSNPIRYKSTRPTRLSGPGARWPREPVGPGTPSGPGARPTERAKFILHHLVAATITFNIC